jgi:hypothetical protein
MAEDVADIVEQRSLPCSTKLAMIFWYVDAMRVPIFQITYIELLICQ